MPERHRFVFYVKMRPYTYEEEEQSVEVLANDALLGRIALRRGWQEYRVEVPTSDLQIGTKLFTFVPAFATSPARCSESRDRPLSIAFDYMVIDGTAIGSEL